MNVNDLINVKNELENVKELLQICLDYNKKNGKKYNSFSNKITNGRGCVRLGELIHWKITLERIYEKRIRKLKNKFTFNKTKPNKYFLEK